MERNDKVKIFAPYFREKIEIVRDPKRVPAADSMDAYRDQPIGVEGATLAHTVLLAADGGRLRGSVHQYKSSAQALAELKAGRLAAVMALRSEIEAGMAGTTGFEVSAPPLPGLPRNGWVLGVAVKAENEALAQAVQQAVNELDAEGELGRIFARHGVRRLAP
jgi:ABC-type amino acid transport substrate-binding protein